MIDEAKRRPGQITLNGGGHGTDDHIAVLGISANTGTSFQMVHFRGTPEGKTQVLGGNIDILAANVSEVAEDIKSGTDPRPRRDVARTLAVHAQRADVPRAGLQ